MVIGSLAVFNRQFNRQIKGLRLSQMALHYNLTKSTKNLIKEAFMDIS